MDPQTELHDVVISSEQRHFGRASAEEIRRELKHYGVDVEEITASLRTYLARRIAEPARPQVPSRKDEPESCYLEELPAIERIAAFTARRAHLNADETAEFVDVVRLRLFENDYAIIRRFEGGGSFTTYLTTVIVRLFHEYRIRQWGKWRPSAEARRLGDTAVTLERLLTRDGFTLEEAVTVLTTRSNSRLTRSELEAIYARLPVRSPRPLFVSTESPPEAPSTASADDRVQDADRERLARVVAAVMDAAMHQMSSEDQAMLQMRFRQGMKVPDIGRVLSIDQKKLYKRLDSLLGLLRRSLEHAGIDRSAVEDLLSHPASDFTLESMPERMQTASDVKRPS